MDIQKQREILAILQKLKQEKEELISKNNILKQENEKLIYQNKLLINKIKSTQLDKSSNSLETDFDISNSFVSHDLSQDKNEEKKVDSKKNIDKKKRKIDLFDLVLVGVIILLILIQIYIIIK